MFALGIVTWCLALACFADALINQSEANRPVGEGEVFAADTRSVAEMLTASTDAEEAIRHARNILEVEAVSLVTADGVVEASTSDTLSGGVVSNPFLASGIEGGRFAALAVATESEVMVDGVVEWPVGSILYEVVAPRPDGEGAILLHYDVAELLSRRARPGHIDPVTIQLLVLGLVFTLLGGALIVGHSRAARRYRQMARESDVLRDYSERLESANVELAEARIAAERALALAEEKMRIRSDFVLMINHELRTPLTAVVTGANLLRSGGLSGPEREELVDSMIVNGARLNEIIDQILAVARIENRGLSYELSRVPLNELCEAIGISVVPDDAPDRQTFAHTDLGTVSLVVSSLAANALEHGAGEVRVMCTKEPLRGDVFEIGSRPSECVFIDVADDGPGIDPDFLPRAFEKFEKNSFKSGTGLGLYMVRLMVDALRGSISVRTTPEGTTFQIALPALVVQKVAQRI